MKGWIYVIWGESAPGLSKIGYTMKDPELRLKELDTTGVSGQLHLACSYLVRDPSAVEASIHRELSAYHYRKEWFQIEPGAAISKLDGLLDGAFFYREALLKISVSVDPQSEEKNLREFRRAYSVEFSTITEMQRGPTPFAAPEEVDFVECVATSSWGDKERIRVKVDYAGASHKYPSPIFRGRARIDAQEAAELALVRRLMNGHQLK
jgi:hypothetical protein